MKSKFKSLLSLCLAVVLMVTMFSGMAFANDITPIEMLEPESFDIVESSSNTIDIASTGRSESKNDILESTSDTIDIPPTGRSESKNDILESTSDTIDIPPTERSESKNAIVESSSNIIDSVNGENTVKSATLTVSPSTAWSVGASGGSRAISVSGTGWTQYSVFAPSWVSVNHTAAGRTTLTAQANSSSARSGTIEVRTNAGQSRTFSVSQSAGTPTLTINPTSNWNIPVSGQTRQVNVTTNLSTYTVSGRPSWISLEWLSPSITGFRLTAQANTGAARSATIIVRGAGVSDRSFTVSQAAGTPTLTINPTSNWSVPASGQTRQVNVTTNLSTYSVSGRPSWMSIDWLSPSITGFRLTAQPNTGAARSATITVRGTGVSDRSFTVSQAAGSVSATLTVTPSTAWSVAHTGGSRAISVEGTGWTEYSVFAPSWVTVNHTAPGRTTLTAQANSSGARSGTIEVRTNAGQSRTFSVSQSARPVLPANPYAALNFAYPLPAQYNGISTYSGHLGLDIHAPKNTPIYSAESGTVRYAGFGGDGDKGAGFYISIVHNVNDPTKTGSNPMITRYLHINSQENILVSATPGRNTVGRGIHIGYVGSRGAYVGGTRYNHLHMDANSSNADSPSSSNFIDPTQFWPNTFVNATQLWPGYDSDFPALRSGALSASANEKRAILNDKELVESGKYIDIELIRLVGSDKFEEWLSNNPDYTVYKFIEDFNISNAKLESKLAEHIYEEYVESSPVAYRSRFSDSHTVTVEHEIGISRSEADVSTD